MHAQDGVLGGVGTFTKEKKVELKGINLVKRRRCSGGTGP
jgi:hypothetical protein